MEAADQPLGPSSAEAIQKLDWYAMRRKIETFHKILESGCKAEDSKRRTADGLANLISVFCILIWRLFWLTMISRCAPEAPLDAAFTPDEIQLLERVVSDSPLAMQAPPLLRNLIKVARFGGYLARASDPPRGQQLCGAACNVLPILGWDMNSP